MPALQHFNPLPLPSNITANDRTITSNFRLLSNAVAAANANLKALIGSGSELGAALSYLSPSLPVFTNAANQLVSNAMTGTGSVVMGASPTGTGTWTLPIINASGIITSTATGSGSSSGLQVSAALPSISLNETDVGADLRRWDIRANAGTLEYRAVQASGAVDLPYYTVTRDANGFIDTQKWYNGSTPDLRMNMTGSVLYMYFTDILVDKVRANNATNIEIRNTSNTVGASATLFLTGGGSTALGPYVNYDPGGGIPAYTMGVYASTGDFRLVRSSTFSSGGAGYVAIKVEGASITLPDYAGAGTRLALFDLNGQIVAGSLISSYITGTGLDNQIAVWSGAQTQDGSTSLVFDGTTLVLTGNLSVSGTSLLTGAVTNSALTANGVMYANGSKVLSSHANLTWDTSTLALTGALTVSGLSTLTGGVTTTAGAIVINSATVAHHFHANRNSATAPASNDTFIMSGDASVNFWGQVWSASTASLPQFVFRRGGGSFAAVAATPNAARMGSWTIQGTVDGSTWVTTGFLRYESLELHSGTSMGNKCIVHTTPIGSATNATVFTFANAANVSAVPLTCASTVTTTGLLTTNGGHTMAASSTSVPSFNIIVGTAPTTPTIGDGWHDSTRKALTFWGSGGIAQYLSSQIWAKTADTTVANLDTEQSVLDTGVGNKTLPANCLTASKSILVRVSGYFSTLLTPTIRFKLKMGSTIICDSGAVTTATGVANGLVYYEFRVTCRSTGASGTVMPQSMGWVGSVQIPVAATAAVTVDTTATQAIGVTVTWGTANALNTVTITNVQFILEG